MRFIIAFVCISLSCINFANADTGVPSYEAENKTLAVALSSELGDSVPYYDQGFASLMKNQLEIPAHGAIETTLHQNVKLALSKRGYTVIFHELSPTESQKILDSVDIHRDLFPTAETRLNHLKESGILSSLNVDLLITLKKEPVRGEHIKGLGVVTKNGALGFTHLTRVYLAAQMAIYEVKQPIELGSAVVNRFVEMPSIYRDWEKEVAAGLSATVETNVSNEISKLLQDLTQEAFSSCRW